MIRMVHMRMIYLSPHLDDAVLSAGGLMHDQSRRGMQVEIWTLMAGFPGEQELSEFARTMHSQWGTATADETVRLRRAEDDRAAAKIGARAVHFDFFDCIYRKDASGHPLYDEAMYVPTHACDAELPSRIAAVLRSNMRQDDEVVCQLGIGEHVDHLLVRSAAEMLAHPLTYDADIPYLLNHPDELSPRTALMKGSLQPITPEGVTAWLEAIAEYRSQLSTLFDPPTDLPGRIRDYWAGEGGIRLWTSPVIAHGQELKRP